MRLCFTVHMSGGSFDDVTVWLDDETGMFEVRDPKRAIRDFPPFVFGTEHEALRKALSLCGWGLYVRRMTARDYNRELAPA